MNSILLHCFKCHDKIELLTDELFSSKTKYSIETLRQFIINNSFPNENDNRTN